MVVPRHQQEQDPEVLRGIAGLSFRANTPCAEDLHGHVARRPVADVR
jgi:hypothetical protein